MTGCEVQKGCRGRKTFERGKLVCSTGAEDSLSRRVGEGGCGDCGGCVEQGCGGVKRVQKVAKEAHHQMSFIKLLEDASAEFTATVPRHGFKTDECFRERR